AGPDDALRRCDEPGAPDRGARARAARTQPQPARQPRAGSLRPGHPGRDRRVARGARRRVGAGGAGSLPPVEPRGGADRRHPRARRRRPRHRHQPGRPHPLRHRPAGCPRRRRQPGGRGPPLERPRPRAVPPPVGDRAGRRRPDRRAGSCRLRAGAALPARERRVGSSGGYGM
ncbi:MAG: 3-dehydroquinate dehydratase II, partial [uncultured Thermomicrobiales bacterium]